MPVVKWEIMKSMLLVLLLMVSMACSHHHAKTEHHHHQYNKKCAYEVSQNHLDVVRVRTNSKPSILVKHIIFPVQKT